MTELSPTAKSPLTGTQWLICVIAAIGFAFDIYELLMLPLIVRPALMQLIGAAPGTDEFQKWVGLLFFVPAFAGGIFGFLGGYLTDRLGRRRVLTWSILLYAGSAFAAGFATNIYMLLFLRCLVFIGVCVEFVAAVAWLAELFPDPKRREKVLGYTQAFSSIGGLLVAVANGLAVAYADKLPAIYGSHDTAWRYTLMSGLIPAIPLIVIRPFLPESPAWAKKKAEGRLRRPRIAELFSPQLRRTTVVTTVMFACSFGAAFGAIQMMPQIAPGLPDVKKKVAEATGSIDERIKAAQAATRPAAGPATVPAVPAVADGVAPATQPADVLAAAVAPATRTTTQPAGPSPIAKLQIEKRRETSQVEQKMASDYTKVQEVGGLVGRFLLAMLAVAIVSRRSLLRIFQVPGLILMPLIFGYAAVNNFTLFSVGSFEVTLFMIGMFVAGLVTVAQFSFWGNYLPRVYPLHLRGTGESFAANIGGRMIGTSFAWVTATIVASDLFPAGMTTPTKVAYTAAGVALFVYLLGFICSFFLPEPGPEEEGDH